MRIAAIIAIGAWIRLALVPAGSHPADLAILDKWFMWIASVKPDHAYNMDISYPPMFVVIDEAWSRIIGTANVFWDIKGPSLIGDALEAAAVYFISGRSLLALAYVWLNPAVIYDSAYWGQNDSIPTAFALGALAARDTVSGFPLWALGCLVKPPFAVIAPLLVRFRIQSVLGLLCAYAIAWVIAQGFFPGDPMQLISHAVAGAHLYPWTSINAFDLWAVWMPFYVDDTPYKMLSYVLFSVTMLCALRTKNRYLASTIIMLSFFVVLTEVHERYLYYAVVMCGTLMSLPFMRLVGLVLTATLFLNLEYVLPTTAFNFSWTLVHSLSLLNCVVLVALIAYSLIHVEPPEPALPQSHEARDRNQHAMPEPVIIT